jgi:hypothetical protein
MNSDSTSDTHSFVLPAQTVRGSRQEMLATIDQAIVGLLALRHLVAGESLVMPGGRGAGPANPERRAVSPSIAQVGSVLSSLMRRHV